MEQRGEERGGEEMRGGGEEEKRGEEAERGKEEEDRGGGEYCTTLLLQSGLIRPPPRQAGEGPRSKQA